MATIPNYYFQSPSIEAASRNLATALQPPDPRVQLAAQAQKFAFDRAKQKAQEEDFDRSEKEMAQSDFAHILSFDPIRKPDGTVDDEATEAAVLKLYASGVEHGGDPKIGGELAGPLAPQFQTKKIMADLKNTYAAQLLASKLGVYTDVARMNEGGRNERQLRDQGFRADLSDQNYRQQLEIDTNRAQLRMEENARKIKDGGGSPPPIVAGTVLQDIVHKLRFRQQQTGRPMEQRYMDKLVDEASQLFQKNRNVMTSINTVWSAHGLDDTAPQKQHKGAFKQLFEDDYDYLVPKGYDDAPGAPVTAPPDGSLGAAAAGARSPSAAPALAPTRPAGPPREGDTTKSKSGKPMIFRNGKWIYQ